MLLGERDGTRTHDLLIKSQRLSHSGGQIDAALGGVAFGGLSLSVR